VLAEVLTNPLFTNVVAPLGFILLGFILRYIYKQVSGMIHEMQTQVLDKVNDVDTKVENVITEQARVKNELFALGNSYANLKERTAMLEGKAQGKAEAISEANARAMEALTKGGPA
jgi:F0F1-type ATP synthase membrane subunit b/b'